MRRVVLAATLGALSLFAFAVPASATVHEITGMFCAGEHGNHFPAGLSGGSNPNANNFAKPLVATGFIASVLPYEGDGVHGEGVLITFDFDHPASKIAPHPTLDTFFVGDQTYIRLRARLEPRLHQLRQAARRLTTPDIGLRAR